MAAVVTKLGDKSATIVLKNGKQAELGWNGIKWARSFITDDRQSFAPKSARDVLKVGARSGYERRVKSCCSPRSPRSTPPWWP